MNIIKKILLVIILLFVPLYSAYGDDGVKYPKPTQYKYVNDYAAIVNSDTRNKIISIGDELYKKTKCEIVVVTIDALPQNTDIESYADGLFRDWGIGSKELNNGVLLLVSVNDRKMRIEVGYGLEGAIPDSVAGSISDNYIVPYFLKGDYNSGILNGYYGLCSRAAKEYNIQLSGGTVSTDEFPQTGTRGLNIPIIIALILLFIFDGVFLRFRILRFIFFILLWGGRGGRGGFGGGSGGGFGGFGGGSSGGGGSSRNW